MPKKRVHIEIKFAGFGGQGMILAGHIIGKAATIYEDYNVVLTRSYGPEARGGASSSNVIIDTSTIDYPYVSSLDALIVMSQESYDKYIDLLKEGGYLFLDSDLVKIPRETYKRFKVYSIPATGIAEKIGRHIVANIVMLGFFTRITGYLKYESVLNAVLTTVPPKTIELNKKAFNEGFEYGEKLQMEVTA